MRLFVVREELKASIKTHRYAFRLDLSDDSVDRLADYYDLILEHNPQRHLVAPCSPEEFAVRHILESLTLLEYLPKNTQIADLGTGAGLPSIPCLIVRTDLRARLIESKEKKARFLETAAERLGVGERAEIVNRQFAETDPGNAEFITCRALDKFTERLPRLIKWSKGRRVLFFGGPALGAEMRSLGLDLEQRQMPLSDRRYLFVTDA